MTGPRSAQRDIGRLGLLARLTRRHLWLFIADVLVGMVFFLFALFPGLALRDFLNSLPGTTAMWGIPLAPLLAYVGFKIANAVGAAAWMAVDTVFRYRIYTDVRTSLLRQMFSRPAALPPIAPAGDILARFREDTVEVAEVLGKRGIQLVTSALVLSGSSLAVLFAISPRVTVLAVLPTLAISVIAFLASKEIKRLREVDRRAASDVSAFLRECFAGIETIKVANASDRIVTKVHQLNAARRRAAVRDGAFGGALNSTQGLVIVLGSALVMFVVADGIRNGTFLVGDFAMFVYSLANLGTLVAAVGGFVSRYQRFSVTTHRLAALTPSGLTRAIAATPPDLDDDQPQGLPKVRAGQPVIAVHDLDYHHPNGKSGLSSISFEGHAGDVILVTGPVGSGKTTLVRTVLGLLPRSGGTIEILEQRLQPGLPYTPPLASYTPQTPRVFSDTLAENVLLGQSIERLDPALAASTLSRDVPHLSDGADTQIGPSGHRLSGGQLHRLAAARMLARPAAVMVIDDLSASLDIDTERSLVQRLLEQSTNCVLIVVSNRPHMRQHATQIIDLDGGTSASTRHEHV